MPVTSISTAGVPANQKVRYWTASLRRMFAYLDIDPLGETTLDSRIDQLTLSALQLYRIEGTRMRVGTSPESSGAGTAGFVQMLFQNEGRAYFEQDEQTIEINPGDCLAYDPGRPHRVINPIFTRAYAVRVPKELLLQRGLPSDRMRAMKRSGAPAAQVAHDFIENLVVKAPALAADVAPGVANVLLDLLMLPFPLHCTSIAGLRHADLLRLRAKNFIAKTLRNPDLRIETIAKALGCTKRSVHMAFHDEGTTASAYIWQSRLDLCRAELEAPTNSGLSITAIALSCGFSSSAHFCRLFKQRFGCSPSALRRREA